MQLMITYLGKELLLIMEGKIILVVYKNRKMKGKNGKEFCKSCYFFQPSNDNKRIAIKPLFAEGFAQLNYICEKVFDESTDEKES